MKNPDKYNYRPSEVLGLEIAEAKDKSHVYTSDGVKYTKSEISILKNNGGLNKDIHLVKKIFTHPGDGGIVKKGGLQCLKNTK